MFKYYVSWKSDLFSKRIPENEFGTYFTIICDIFIRGDITPLC